MDRDCHLIYEASKQSLFEVGQTVYIKHFRYNGCSDKNVLGKVTRRKLIGTTPYYDVDICDPRVVTTPSKPLWSLVFAGYELKKAPIAPEDVDTFVGLFDV